MLPSGGGGLWTRELKDLPRGVEKKAKTWSYYTRRLSRALHYLASKLKQDPVGLTPGIASCEGGVLFWFCCENVHQGALGVWFTDACLALLGSWSGRWLFS